MAGFLCLSRPNPDPSPNPNPSPSPRNTEKPRGKGGEEGVLSQGSNWWCPVGAGLTDPDSYGMRDRHESNEISEGHTPNQALTWRIGEFTVEGVREDAGVVGARNTKALCSELSMFLFDDEYSFMSTNS